MNGTFNEIKNKFNIKSTNGHIPIPVGYQNG